MALKAAVVGMGGIGNTHARCYHEDPLSELVAVCDIDKAKADTAAEKFGCKAFYDEEEMTDPMVVDTGLKHSADNMVNEFVKLAIDEFDKANLVQEAAAWSFDVVVDAIAKMNVEDESGLFLLISPADKAAFRKALKDDLNYSEGYVRTGYIGTVAGVPVIVSKAVEAGTGYLATKDAVTTFIKKDTETEYERDADKRNNSYWVRKVAVVALTDATKAVKITIGA